MAAEQNHFTELMRRLGEGSPEAARELFERYGPHVRRVIRRKLSQEMRARFDSQDFLQEVWKSFFVGEIRPDTFDRPEALRKFLEAVATHKVVEAFRGNVVARKRQATREHSLESSIVRRRGEPASAQPTPSATAAADDQWDQLLKGRPARHQTILKMLRQGAEPKEIAPLLGVSQRMVYRLRDQLMQCFQS